MKGYLVYVFFLFLLSVTESRSRADHHFGKQKLVKYSSEANNTLSFVVNDAEDKNKVSYENVTSKETEIKNSQTTDFNDLKKLCDELKHKFLNIPIFVKICEEYLKAENTSLTKHSISESNNAEMVYDQPKQNSNEEELGEIYSEVSNNLNNSLEGYQVKNNENNNKEMNVSLNYDDYPFQDDEINSNFSVALEGKNFKLSKEEKNRSDIHIMVTVDNEIQNVTNFEKENSKSQGNNSKRVEDKSFDSTDNENKNTEIVIKLDEGDADNPKGDSKHILKDIKDKRLMTANVNNLQNETSPSDKINNIIKHKVKIHTRNKSDEANTLSKPTENISNETLNKVLKNDTIALNNHSFSSEKDQVKENDKHSSDENKVKIKQISVQPKLPSNYKEQKIAANKILKGSSLGKGIKTNHPLASAKRTLARSKVNNNNKESEKRLGNKNSHHNIEESQNDNELDKMEKESPHEEEKKIITHEEKNSLTPLKKATTHTKLLIDLRNKKNNPEQEKKFNDHKNKTNEKKGFYKHVSPRVNKNQGPETESKQIFAKIPSDTKSFDEHNKTQENQINKEEKENKNITSQNKETEPKDMEEQKHTKLRQHGNADAAYSTVLIGVCSTLIISTIFLTIIGVYYRKVNLERRKYYGHVLLNPEEDIALFNQANYNGDVDRYESWNSQFRT